MLAVRDSTASATAVPVLAEAAADLFLLPAGDDLVLVQAGDRRQRPNRRLGGPAACAGDRGQPGLRPRR